MGLRKINWRLNSLSITRYTLRTASWPTSMKHFCREVGISPSRICRTASISSLAAYPPRSLAKRLKRSVTHTHTHTFSSWKWKRWQATINYKELICKGAIMLSLPLLTFIKATIPAKSPAWLWKCGKRWLNTSEVWHQAHVCIFHSVTFNDQVTADLVESAETTYTWTSPHRALGSKAPDPRSDCWSAALWTSLRMRCRSPETAQTKTSEVGPSSRTRIHTFPHRWPRTAILTKLKSNNPTLMWWAAWMWAWGARQAITITTLHFVGWRVCAGIHLYNIGAEKPKVEGLIKCDQQDRGAVFKAQGSHCKQKSHQTNTSPLM